MCSRFLAAFFAFIAIPALLSLSAAAADPSVTVLVGVGNNVLDVSVSDPDPATSCPSGPAADQTCISITQHGIEIDFDTSSIGYDRRRKSIARHYLRTRSLSTSP